MRAAARQDDAKLVWRVWTAVVYHRISAFQCHGNPAPIRRNIAICIYRQWQEDSAPLGCPIIL